MLPHPETVNKINALRHQERLQDVTRQRRVIHLHPDAGAPSRTPTPLRSRLAPASWFTSLMARAHGGNRRRKLIPAANSPA